jgi:manganese/zinc/iron transport system substrate-binding protein
MFFTTQRDFLSGLRLISFYASLATFAILASCGSDTDIKQTDSALSNEKMSIVVTTTHLNDIVSRIVGDRFKVVPLMGPGVDPHLYRPTSRDALAISNADLIVFHGMMLEGKLAETLQNSRNKGIPSYNATEKINPKKIIGHSKSSKSLNHPDPHVWFDPSIWSNVVQNLSDRISILDPEGTEIYKSNTEKICAEIYLVSEWAKNRVNEIPENKRKLITSHDAFQYFGRAMGLNVVALQGISTTAEAGLADRVNLVNTIMKEKIPAIFIESSVNPNAINEIARECKISIGGKLFSDALGSGKDFVIGPKSISFPCNTWSGMMVHNINTIVDSLK